MNRLLVPLLIVVALCGSRTEATAQGKWFEAFVDNDALTGFLPGRDPSDREYTHGMWFAEEKGGSSFWGSLLPGVVACWSTEAPVASCSQTRIEGGFKMYTPDYRAAFPDSLQRPYAGWLYGAVTGRIVRPSIERSLRAELGFTGRPTMAEFLQRIVHEVAHYDISNGWDDQLAFEPGILLRYRERRVLGLEVSGDRLADIIPAWQVSLGNVHTGAAVGVTARAGYRLPHPWEAAGPGDDLAAWAFARVAEHWTGHDLFLDGNTFRESARVDKRPFTNEYELGLAVEYRRIRLTASVIRESLLYETQLQPQLYARTGISYAP